MAAAYPNAIKTFSSLQDGIDTILAAHPNDRANEITAIETELGTNPAGAFADVVTRLNSADQEAGSYSGNGSGPRDIAVSFNPRWVIIFGHGTDHYAHFISTDSNVFWLGGGQANFSTGGTLGTLKFTVGATDQEPLSSPGHLGRGP